MSKLALGSRLNDANDAALTDYALTSGAAVYSNTIVVRRGEGFITILVTEDKSGGAGDVDISAEYSMDGTNWYTPYISNMAGVITAEGNIATALGNATRWIVFTARLSRYLRFKFDPDANSQITVDYIFQEQL